MLHTITQGLDIPIDGQPEQVVSGRCDSTTVALLGEDYVGLRPVMHVRTGDRVKLGQPLFADRKHRSILFTSPGSGTVKKIVRGARRALLSVAISLDGDEQEIFPSWSAEMLTNLRRDQITETLLASGLWTAFRTRPYSLIPDPEIAPHSVFVTATDSNPLAARPDVVVQDNAADFANGLNIIARLTDGSLHLCQRPDAKLPKGDAPNIIATEFGGPHPSGLVGTHIHSLDPVGAGKTVWHVGYQDVIAIGKLFTTGRIWSERVVALAGPLVRQPRLTRARLGADLHELTQKEFEGVDARIISGSVLSGRAARMSEAHLGRYHTQVSVIAESGRQNENASANNGAKAFSMFRPFGTVPDKRRSFDWTSALHGRPAPMIPFGQFERVMPLDILPTQLLRALLVGDTDMAQALGCLELDEEDVALCSFVCPSKLDYGPMLREALARIAREG